MHQPNIFLKCTNVTFDNYENNNITSSLFSETMGLRSRFWAVFLLAIVE